MSDDKVIEVKIKIPKLLYLKVLGCGFKSYTKNDFDILDKAIRTCDIVKYSK